MKREKVEWCQFYWFDTPERHLPRILLIGDSIVVGHGQAVARRLQGEATVGFYSTSKIVGDPAIYRELALALADESIDVILFNNGLHGIDCPDECYRAGLEAFADTLRHSTRAMLAWRNSTPLTVPDSPAELEPVKNAIVLRRNAIAAEVMAKRNIPTLDLYTAMLNHPEYRLADGYHYQETGIERQADLVAEYLRGMLARRNLMLNLDGAFETDFPGKVSDWNGFARYDFTLNGERCILVKPNCAPAPGKPWLWRARFFGAFPYADLELLRRGWHIAHIRVEELYGSPESNRRFDLLYAFLTKLGFALRCALAGFSRGGLDTVNWAAKNTDKVACLYLDNPVCDFKSWPYRRASEEWKRCLAAYGFTEAEALAWKGNPVDNLAPLANAKIPLLIVCSDADETVPPEENALIVEPRYRVLGGEVEMIHKPGVGHHPHSLENPAPIVAFLEKHCLPRRG